MASAHCMLHFHPYHAFDLLDTVMVKKTDDLPKRFGLLHYDKPIENGPVFQGLPHTFA